MKHIASLALAVLLMVLPAGCNSRSDEIYSKVMSGTASESGVPLEDRGTPEPDSLSGSVPVSRPEAGDDRLSGQLTVKDFYRNANPGALTALEVLAEEFMELHPHVTVTVDYDTADADELEQKKQAYSARVRMELLSGEADYLLFSPKEEMGLSRLSESGVLLDLRPYWENDPEIDPEDYFVPVLDAVSVEGKWTALPLSFGFEGLFLNRRVLEELGVDPDSLTGLDYRTLLDWYDRAAAAEPDLQVTYGGWVQESFFGVERSAYLDLENRTASFQSPEFVEFLTRTGKISEPDARLDDESRSMRMDADFLNAALQCKAEGRDFPVKNLYFAENFLEEGPPSLACLSGISPAQMAYFRYPLEYLAGPYPWVNTQGRLAVVSKEELCVPASIADPELAWEFVKYCLGERESMELSNGEMATYYFPLHKKNFTRLMEAFSGGGGHQYRYMAMMGSPMGRFGGELALEKLEGYLSLPLISGKLYGIDADEYLDEFYVQKLLSAEQCAEKIQGRAEIWLNE